MAPMTLYAKSFGTSSATEVANAIATDSSNALYVTGYYSGASTTIGSTSLSLSGGKDVFVAKYDLAGAVSWAVRFGGSSNDIGMTIAIDSSSSGIYLAGTFTSSSFTMGSSFTLKSTQDIFLAKLSTSSGSVSWGKQLYISSTTSNAADARALALDSSDNIFLTGDFKGTLAVGNSLTVSSTSSGQDVFIAKFDSTGLAQWVKTFGGSSYQDTGTAIATDSSGNVYVTGFFKASSMTVGSTALTNKATGSSDIWVVKYTSSGSNSWAKSFGSTGTDEPYGLDVDSSGGVYITGLFSGSLSMGSNTLSNSGGNDIFVAKLDSSGSVVWTNDFGGSSSEEVRISTGLRHRLHRLMLHQVMCLSLSVCRAGV